MRPELSAVKRLRELLDGQALAVLATRGPEYPYQSLVAFAATADLRRLVFATTRSTRKYANLQADARASMHINDAHRGPADFLDAAAVTAAGSVVEPTGEELERLRDRYLSRHPHLTEFATSEDSALLCLHVAAYHLVERFQNVYEIRPGDSTC